MPVLILSGKQDLSSTSEMMLATAKIYKNSRFETIDPGTHMMVMEQAQAVANALAIFREQTEASLRLVRVA